jgi:hypothetical protein
MRLPGQDENRLYKHIKPFPSCRVLQLSVPPTEAANPPGPERSLPASTTTVVKSVWPSKARHECRKGESLSIGV